TEKWVALRLHVLHTYTQALPTPVRPQSRRRELPRLTGKFPHSNGADSRPSPLFDGPMPQAVLRPAGTLGGDTMGCSQPEYIRQRLAAGRRGEAAHGGRPLVR